MIYSIDFSTGGTFPTFAVVFLKRHKKFKCCIQFMAHSRNTNNRSPQNHHNHDKFIDEQLRALDLLTRRSPDKVPANLVHLLHEAHEIVSPIAEWKQLGVLLHIGREIGVPLHVRWISLDTLYAHESNVIFPLIICALHEGEYRQLAILRRKGDLLMLKPVAGGEAFWLRKAEFTALIQNSSIGNIITDTEVAETVALFESLGVDAKGIEKFRLQHSDAEFIRLGKFLQSLNTGNDPRSGLAQSIIKEPILWSALSGLPSTMLHIQGSSNDGIYAIVAEDIIDYISPSERFHHSEDHDEHHVLDHGSIFKKLRSRPVERFLRLIKFEKRDILVLCGYGLVISLLSLVTPLAIDSLVNTISAGTVTLPLIVLSGIVFVGLLFSGLISLIQQYVAEIMKQRIFVNTAFEIANKLPNAKLDFFTHEYAPELVNRFFDVITLQKTFSKILLDGVSAAFTAIAGLFLLAFFSPILLAVGIVLIIISIIIVVLFGRGGLQTSINESHEKYLVAASLEEVGRCLTSFKLVSSPRLLYNKVDELLTAYVRYRRMHFKILFRQQAIAVVIKVLFTVSVLVVGGMLVIEREISLGQLVATQIVILFLISGVENLFKQLENIYDMLTSLEKLAQVTDIAQERIGGTILPERHNGVELSLKSISFGYENATILNNVSLTIKSGERFCLVGKSGEGKSTLANLLLSMEQPSRGTILFDEFDVQTINLATLRSQIGIALPSDEIIEGTIYDNIVMGREWITPADVLWALQMVRLDDALLRLPKGLQTRLLSHGKNLSTGQVRRVMLARAIVSRPRLLIIDEAFNGIEEYIKLEILSEILHPSLTWTIVSITHDPEVVAMSSTVAILENGNIAAYDSVEAMSQTNELFLSLFPDIRHQLEVAKKKSA